MVQRSGFCVDSRRGFTLIELMVVLLIIAVLLGTSIAIIASMGSTAGLRSAEAQISSVINIARSEAIAEGQGSQVVFDLKNDLAYALTRRTVGLWHFEKTLPDDLFVTPGYSPNTREDRNMRFYPADGASGMLVADGRTGWAMQLYYYSDRAEVNAGRDFDLDEGLAFSFSIKSPTPFQALADGSIDPGDGIVFQKGESYGVALALPGDPIGRAAGATDIFDQLEVSHQDAMKPYLVAFVKVGRSATLYVTSDYPLTRDAWYDVDVIYDGIQLRMNISGVEQNLKVSGDHSLAPSLFQPISLAEGAPLMIGDLSKSATCYIDELKISAISYSSDVFKMPEGISIEMPLTPELGDYAKHIETMTLYLAADGGLDPRYHQDPVGIVLRTMDDKGNPQYRKMTVNLLGVIE
ncbi:MAG: prepilin-type N-terminal cleavage/methylation domain-containing protein [Planctomycetes bacterium]|nr:prepilin-type N-terminal cleavage/methylation domain-containing protein [Planctomycetota bacterium]